MAVYRIPLKKVYRKNHKKEDTSWDEVYGSVKCLKCKKHFKEGETYIVVMTWHPTTNGGGYPVHKYQHTECSELKENLPIRKKVKEREVQRK